MGYLFSKLEIRRFDQDIAMKIFKTYIEPILTYGLVVFWGRVSQNSIQRMNAVMTKFIKRWIGIPTGSNNAFLYHYTNTCPLSVWCDETLFDRHWGKLQLPHLENFLLKKPDFRGNSVPTISQIPTYMWTGQISYSPPKDPKYRSKIGKKIFGWEHRLWCSKEKFHTPYLPKQGEQESYEYMHEK